MGMKSTRELFPQPILEDGRADRILRSAIGEYLLDHGPDMDRLYIDTDKIFADISEGVFKYFVFRKDDGKPLDDTCGHDIVTEMISRGYVHKDGHLGKIFCLPNNSLEIETIKDHLQYKIWCDTLAWKDCTVPNSRSRTVADRLEEFDRAVPAMKKAAQTVFDYLNLYLKQKEIITATVTAMEEANGFMVTSVYFPPLQENRIRVRIAAMNGASHEIEMKWKDLLKPADTGI